MASLPRRRPRPRQRPLHLRTHPPMLLSLLHPQPLLRLPVRRPRVGSSAAVDAAGEVPLRFPVDTRGSGAVGGDRDFGGGCGGGEGARGDEGGGRRRQAVRGFVLRVRAEQGGVHGLGGTATAPALPRRGAGRRFDVRLHGPAGGREVGSPTPAAAAALPIQHQSPPLRHPFPRLVFLGLVCMCSISCLSDI